MSTRIAIPIKVKLDPQSARRGRADVSRAARRALDRILVNAQNELAATGGLEKFDVPAAVINWSGQGLANVSAEHRAALETDIREVIAAAVERAIERRSNPDAPEVLAPGERAAFDPDMLVGGIYVVDSYDTSGENGAPTAPTQREGLQFIDNGEEWVPRDGQRYTHSLYNYIDDRDLRRAIQIVLQEAIDQNSAPARGRVGFVYSGNDEQGRAQARTAVINFNGSASAINIVDKFNFPGFVNISPSVQENDEADVSSSASSSNVFGITTMRKRAGDADALEAYYEFARPKLEALYEAHLRERTRTITPRLRTAIRAAIRAHCEDMVLTMQDLNPSRRLVLVEIDPPGAGSYSGPLPSEPFGGQNELSVIHLLDVHPADENTLPDGETQIGDGQGSRGSNRGRSGNGNQTGRSGGGGQNGQNQSGNNDGEGGRGGDGSGSGGRPEPFRFPAPTRSNPGDSLVCEPFHGEASLEELGEAGRRLNSLIGRIAWRLQMPECQYPAQFLINASKVWGGRVAGAKGFAGERSASIRATKSDQANEGGLGDIGFQPAPSPVIDTIKHLGGTIPLMTELLEAIHATYREPANAAKLHGHSQNNGAHFSFELQKEYFFEIQDNIGYAFKVACQSHLIQLCLASRQQILERLNNFPNYWPIFDSLLRTLVAEEGELRMLREALESHIATSTDIDMQSAVSRTVDNWRNARRNVIALFSSSSSSAILENAQDRVGDATTKATVHRLNGQWVVRDRNGKDWTREELANAIGIRATQGREIDPLLSKLTDLPDVQRIAEEAPGDAKNYIRALLNEMLEDNDEVTREVEADAHHAFTRGQISEDLVNPTVRGINVRLGGIHLVAHEAIYDSFRGDQHYESALRKIFGIEVGKAELLVVVEFIATVGIVAVSILCPPVGLAAGAVMAGINYGVAHENAEVTNALFNADQVTSTANSELELFMGELEVVMAAIPFAGKALGTAARGGRAVLQQGLRQASRGAFRGMSRGLARQIGTNMRRGIARQILQEVVQEQVSGKLMEQVLGPVLQEVVNELELSRGTGGSGGRPAAGQSLSEQVPEDSGTISRRVRIIDRKLDEAGGNIENNSEGADTARGSGEQ